ncbi:phage tail assembly protein [Oscillatoria sp. FACHB-1406]|uniref:phage tail assembly protein n=1 Tax=Oscillatoria sp. FACHB-1406 TaxID=2692846 RepID=UPI0016876309|nr:phage tail assembly protein [Oscillatoria sp. FACHB-1406]MBD2576487.1 phage tail assembly protein [Oscillatoria sp. FACHB-1406]
MNPTEFNFTLPKGLVDADGHLHRHGTMRLTTAKDELFVQRDYRAREIPGYGFLLLLSRTISRLGNLTALPPELLEELFTLDIAYLREFYNRINQQGTAAVPARCPQCNCTFSTELILAGEPQATP